MQVPLSDTNWEPVNYHPGLVPLLFRGTGETYRARVTMGNRPRPARSWSATVRRGQDDGQGTRRRRKTLSGGSPEPPGSVGGPTKGLA